MVRKVETYTVQEKKRLYGEVDEISTATVQVCTEQLPEFCQGYEPQNILNFDKLGLFIKSLPGKGLMEKNPKVKRNINNV